MHQPFYKDLVTEEYLLPWVRLHGVKDYYQMAVLAKKFPSVKQNFNFVPSLLLQLEDVSKGNIKDKFLELSQKDAADLNEEDNIFILNNFFMSNWPTMIAVYPRYWELLLKRGRSVRKEYIERIQNSFSSDEMRDIQAWFNLSWFSAYTKKEDKIIKELIKKGKEYTEDDKRIVIEKQNEVIKEIIGLYKELWSNGQIEISTTPFYHPILPLLCDTDIAKESWPQIALPKSRFLRREDADKQIQMAIDYFIEKFGKRPNGLWPSEGSVSDEVMDLLCKHGFKWTATDEGILERSIKDKSAHSIRALASEELFQPYYIERNGHRIGIVFRDLKISDKISFIYSKWDAHKSVEDFIGIIHHVADSLSYSDGGKFLVNVIMDGENAWEFYHDNAWPFFNLLYEKLSNDKRIITTKIGDYIEEYPPEKEIKSIFPGSWVNSNFNVWIGHKEDNISWQYLSEARELIEKVSKGEIKSNFDSFAPEEKKERLEKAWQEIYIAEGSDWNWWYGDDHSSSNDKDFDLLYRRHLINVYSLLGAKIPKNLYIAIKKSSITKPTAEPIQFINPVIDGKRSSYYEWLSAGYYQISQGGGAMHYSQPIIKDIYYGFNLEKIFLRFDIDYDIFYESIDKIVIVVEQIKPVEMKIEVSFVSRKPQGVMYYLENESWVECCKVESIALDEIFEMGVGFDQLGCKSDDEINMLVILLIDGKEMEKWPLNGVISFKVPNIEYEASKWHV